MTTVPNLNPIPVVTGDDLLISHDITTNRSGRIAASVLKEYISNQIIDDGDITSANIYHHSGFIEEVLDRTIKVVNTFADLATDTTPVGGQVNLIGHTEPRKGGGIFDVLSAGSRVSDGGHTLVIGSKAYVRTETGVTGVNVYNFGALGDGTTDDSAAIIAAQSFADNILGSVLFPAGGIFKCSNLTLKNPIVYGIILSTGTTTSNAVKIRGEVTAPSRKVFDHSVAAPTNLPGTTVPFMFDPVGSYGSRVNVRWFGAVGDNSTDDTHAVNFCATAISFSVSGGTPYSPLFGPIEMYFPRGNYKFVGTINIPNGVHVKGELSGSNPLTTFIRDEVQIGSASSADMIWLVKDNQNYNENPTQSFFTDISFIWRPISDFGSSTIQLNTSFISWKAAAISVKIRGCWFLGSPQKGSIFSWGNNYVKHGSGIGIAKVNTGADSDGIDVDMSIFDSWFDVIYGSLVNVYDRGYGYVQMYNTYIYQLWMGFAANYSVHTTNRLLFSMDGGTIYGMCVQLSPQFYVPSTGTLSNTVWKEYRNMDIYLNNIQIFNKNMAGQNFAFSNYLVNSSMRMVGCQVDSTDTSCLYGTQPFKLDWQVNSLVLIGNEFHGSMTPNPVVITAPWPKAFISKLEGDVTSNGITSMLYLDSNKIDVGTMDYFILKEAAFSQISEYYCCNNWIDIAPTKFSFSTTGVTKYRMSRNIYKNTANSLETIP